jgi:2-polyprenyl-3-methyl-5-hydroxy-6-metoxy-1,4-benzoquinol methylase
MANDQRNLDATSPSCELCGHPRARRLWTIRFPDHPEPFQLWKCRDCGLVFNWPRLADNAIRDQYDGDYYVFREADSRRWGRATQLYVEHLLPMETRTTGRRLLEIGCAGGELLAIAERRGWNVQGIELSPQASQFARDKRGVSVLTGTLEEHVESVGQYDVAIANDVIEHVPAPRDFLASLRRVVRPGGWITIETPNWGSIWRRLGGPRWLGINRFHIFLFSARCLLQLLQETGFRGCSAHASTNLAYSAWGSRPESAALLRSLPAGLQWRAEQLLNRLTPDSFAHRLYGNPPSSLDQALQRIGQCAGAIPRFSNCLTGDNVAVIGRA